MRLTLLYQVGIANIFVTKNGKLIRLLQSDFHTCEQFCRGASYAGAHVTVRHYEWAGDALQHSSAWGDGPGALFNESKSCDDFEGANLRPPASPDSGADAPDTEEIE